MPQASRIFRVFISSTFSDLKAERNALQKKVYPRLQKLAASYGCRFQAVDLRWGVSEEAAFDQKTVMICLNEITRCQKQSPRPNFIILLGNRYGWKPLPYEISADEFEQISSIVSANERIILESWYLKDINAVPSSYILQPRKDKYKESQAWEQVENEIRNIFYSAIDRLNFTSETFMKYIASATEQEITAGVLNVENSREHVFCYLREIDDMPNDKSSLDFQEFDINAQMQQSNLKDRLREQLGDNVHEYTSKWDIKEPSLDHLDQLCEDVYSDLSRVIRAEINKLKNVTPLNQEIMAHEAFACDRGRVFVGRNDLLEAISDYIEEDNPHALIVWGESGCGKSSLIAKFINQQRNRKEEFIYRFIGATPNSPDGRSLLEGLCQQIWNRYDVDTSDRFSTYEELTIEFKKCLGLASRKKPLTIILDAIDQLSDIDDAHHLNWLPEELPQNVHLIVTTIPGECKRILESKAPHNNQLQIQPMSLKDGEKILNTWLEEASRTLQLEQRENILQNFNNCGLPLYLKLAFEEVRHWRSYDGLPVGANESPGLGTNIRGILCDLLRRLSHDSNHGEVLVSHSLGYLCASKNGLSEDELQDVLSMDSEVLKDFIRRSPKSPQTERIPAIVWSRLYAELEPYLSEYMFDGNLLLRFYHRQVENAVRDIYLAEEVKIIRHRILAQYFAKQDLLIEQNIEKAFNFRKISEQPYQQTRAELWSDLKDTLTDFDFMEAKCESFSVYSLEEDYLRGLELWAGTPEDKKIVSAFEENIKLESHKINKTAEILFSALYNRLYWKDIDDSGPISTACINAARKKKNWLRSIQKLQVNPNPWEFSFEGHTASVNATATTHNGQLIISGSNDNTIKVWEFSTGKLLQTLEGHTSWVSSVCVTPDGKHIISAANIPVSADSTDNMIKIWNLSDGRLTCNLEGHTSGVNALCVTSDGQYLVSGSDDKTIKVWEISTGRLLRSLEGHSDSVNAVCITPDNKIIISSGWKVVIAWELSTGKLLRTIEGHSRRVSAVGITPDGKCVVSGSHDNTIKVWELSTGRMLRQLEGYNDSVNTLCVTPDGKHVISGSDDGTINVQELASGKLLRYLEGRKNSVNTVCITPDGLHIVSGANDSSIRVWDLSTGKLLRCIEGHTLAVEAVAVTSDGSHIISGSIDNTIKIWDLPNRRLIFSLEGHTSWVNTISIAKDGEKLVSGSKDSTVKVWDLLSGELLSSINAITYSVRAVCVTPDGRYIASGGEGENKISIWEISTGRLLRSLEGHTSSVSALNMTPDGKYIVSGSTDCTIKVWEFSTGRLLRSLEENQDYVHALSVTQDGKYIVSGAFKTINIWELLTGKLLLSFEGHNDCISSIAVTPNGKHVISSSHDKTIKVWEFSTGRLLHNLQGHTDCVSSVGITPNGEQIISGSYDTTIKVWNWMDADRKASSLEGHSPTPIGAVSITSDSKYVVSASSRKLIEPGEELINIWELSTGKLLRSLEEHNNLGSSISIDSNNQYIISGSRDNAINVWEFSTGKFLRSYKGHNNNVTTVLITPDSQRIISGSWDCTIKVWDFASGKLLRNLKGHSSWVTALRMTSDGLYIISGSWDKTIKIWKSSNGTLIRSLEGHTKNVTSLSITPDNKYVISGSQDKTIKIWELSTGKLLCSLQGHSDCVNAISITSDAKYVISGSADNTIKMWDISQQNSNTLFWNDCQITAVSASEQGSWIVAGDEKGRVWIFELM